MTTGEILIKPTPKWILINFEELFRYRYLFFIFIWRDVKVRYKQTVLGILWVVLQPIVTAFIFTIFFGGLAKIPSGNLPYQLFVFTGLIFWNLFSSSVTAASNSLIDNLDIIKKVYFPREILPISTALSAMIDFFINLIVLIVFTLYLSYQLNLWLLPMIVYGAIITLLTSVGLGLLLSSLNIKYRDVRYILPFFIQLLLFLSPVIYPSSTIRDSYRLLFALNPMTGVIENVRTLLGGSLSIDFLMLSVSSISAIFVFLVGLIYFRKTERYFADIA